jgi:hypothetical protein
MPAEDVQAQKSLLFTPGVFLGILYNMLSISNGLILALPFSQQISALDFYKEVKNLIKTMELR